MRLVLKKYQLFVCFYVCVCLFFASAFVKSFVDFRDYQVFHQILVLQLNSRNDRPYLHVDLLFTYTLLTVKLRFVCLIQIPDEPISFGLAQTNTVERAWRKQPNPAKSFL